MEQHHYPDFTGEDTDTVCVWEDGGAGGGGLSVSRSKLIPISGDHSHTPGGQLNGGIICKTHLRGTTGSLYTTGCSDYS